MKHQSLNKLNAATNVEILVVPMKRAERLKRWIDLLEAEPHRLLAPLREIEHQPAELRRHCRSENSPLTIAFEDPALRIQGLKGDTVGDCVDFFGLTEDEMHRAFCSCHFGTAIEARDAAAHLRPILARERIRSSLARGVERVRNLLTLVFGTSRN